MRRSQSVRRQVLTDLELRSHLFQRSTVALAIAVYAVIVIAAVVT